MSRACVKLLALTGCLTLAACYEVPPRRPPRRPHQRPTPRATPKPMPSAAPSPRQQEPTPTISNKGQDERSVVIHAEGFPDSVQDLRADDLVEVTLTRGGTTRGRLRTLDTREMSLSVEGTSIVTRLTPDEVASVRLINRPTLRRPDQEIQETPRNERESWLERFADRAVFDGDAPRLWRGRFRTCVAMHVVRPCEVASAAFAAATVSGNYFARDLEPRALDPGDELKVVGVTQGIEQTGHGDVPLGTITLCLLKHGEEVSKLYLYRPLHPSDLNREDLVEFVNKEPSTFVVTHPGAKEAIVRILRVDAKLARAYARAVERLPDRTDMRRMRAQGDPQLPAAEKAIRDIYERFGMHTEDDLHRPIRVWTRFPVAIAGVRLLAFEKELGID